MATDARKAETRTFGEIKCQFQPPSVEISKMDDGSARALTLSTGAGASSKAYWPFSLTIEDGQERLGKFHNGPFK